MIKVYLMEIGGPATVSIVEMAGVPRIGEDVCFDTANGACMEVLAVIWTPGNPDYDVQVRYDTAN